MNHFSSKYFVTMTWALLGFDLMPSFFRRRRLCASGTGDFDRIIFNEADDTLIERSASAGVSRSTATALPVPIGATAAQKMH